MSGGYSKLIMRGFGASFFFLLIAKIGGALKEVVLANAYGTSAVVDAYSLGFAVANWPITIGVVTINALLIPVFAANNRDLDGESDNVAPLVVGVGILGLALTVVIWAALRFGAPMLDLNKETATELAEQAIGMALMVPSGLMAAVLSARLMAARRQLSALFEAIPALFICLAILTIHQQITASSILAWATATGMLGYFFALYIVDPSALRRPPTSHCNRLRRKGLIKTGVFLVLSSQIIFSLGGILIDQLAVAGLSPGDNSTLSYANRLLMLATGLGATAIGRAVMPILSIAEADGQGENLLRRWVAGLFVGGGAVALIGWIMAPFAVRVLFQHGEFTSEDTESVASLLQLGLLQLPFYFSGLILAQAVIIRRRFGLLLLSNSLGVTVKLAFLWLFLDEWGREALMYGTAAMYGVTLMSLGLVYVRIGKSL